MDLVSETDLASNQFCCIAYDIQKFPKANVLVMSHALMDVRNCNLTDTTSHPILYSSVTISDTHD